MIIIIVIVIFISFALLYNTWIFCRELDGPGKVVIGRNISLKKHDYVMNILLLLLLFISVMLVI